MNKTRIAKIAGVAAAVPMLLFATTGSAFADGNVTWTDAATRGCLAWGLHPQDGYIVSTDVPYPFSGCSDYQGTEEWVDSQNNLAAPQSNTWAEHPGNDMGQCLTGYWDTSVYIESCASPINTYEQWREVDLGNGNWQLINRATDMCLDSNNSGGVYLNNCMAGNKYQTWH